MPHVLSASFRSLFANCKEPSADLQNQGTDCRRLLLSFSFLLMLRDSGLLGVKENGIFRKRDAGEARREV